jgi:hypothetical protein
MTAPIHPKTEEKETSMKIYNHLLLMFAIVFSGYGYARISVSPYISIKSTKSVNPNRKKGTETEKIKQRQEAGIKGSISFWRLFKFQLGVGQSKLTTTEKTAQAKDEYGEIDYEEDLNISTEEADKEIRITETQRNAKASLIIDPSFSIFILRAKAGVTARQRVLETEIIDGEKTNLTKGPTYNPHSGFGAGVRFGRTMYFIIEYNFDHYKFPELEPFEREVAVNFGINI